MQCNCSYFLGNFLTCTVSQTVRTFLSATGIGSCDKNVILCCTKHVPSVERVSNDIGFNLIEIQTSFIILCSELLKSFEERLFVKGLSKHDTANLSENKGV